MNDAQINKLVNHNPRKISAPVLVAAVAELKARQDKQKTEAAIYQLERVQMVTDSAVNNLRSARKVEKVEKSYLIDVANAETAFHADGDFQKYELAILTANQTRNKALSR
jgi:hypothetical protein